MLHPYVDILESYAVLLHTRIVPPTGGLHMTSSKT